MENSILIDKNLIIRSGTDGEDLSFELPKEKAGQSFWIKATEGISFYMRHSDNQSGKRVINISAINNSDEAVKGAVVVELDDGTRAECKITVLPKLSMPPRFMKTPEIVFKDGKAVINYVLPELDDNEDQSEISWYRVDNVNRSQFAYVNFAKVSNETDGRKIAVSKDGIPCKEIMLTSADVGTHIKANIKPKHSNSEMGQGLNIVSRIVRPTDVVSDRVVLNAKTAVVNRDYDMEPGYFTVCGKMESSTTFMNTKRPALVTESMGCGVYYNHGKVVDDMSLVVMIDPEDVTGNGFTGPRQYADIYIKYDPVMCNGYALRIEGTAADDGKTVFCLYQMKNGNAIPISDEYISKAFRPGCEITLQVKSDVLTAFISYDDGEDFEDIELRAKTRGNELGGFGFKYMAETVAGHRAAIKYMEAQY